MIYTLLHYLLPFGIILAAATIAWKIYGYNPVINVILTQSRIYAWILTGGSHKLFSSVLLVGLTVLLYFELGIWGLIKMLVICLILFRLRNNCITPIEKLH